MSKHFIINPYQNNFDRSVLEQTETERIKNISISNLSRDQTNEAILKAEDTLKHVHGRVVIKINLEGKNSHTFENGVTIRRERKYNDFNRRVTEPTNATVISGEKIPSQSEILIWHNSLHDTNKIFNYKDNNSDIKYFSIPEGECFAWREKVEDEFKPIQNFAFGLRVFKPYTGFLINIEPTIIKDVLYITTGELKGKIVHTLKSSDYEIIFQEANGQESNLIRCRHFEDENNNEREEIIAIDYSLTEQLEQGELLVGFTTTNCKNLT